MRKIDKTAQQPVRGSKAASVGGLFHFRAWHRHWPRAAPWCSPTWQAQPSPSSARAAAWATGGGPGDWPPRWRRRVRTLDGVDRAENLILRTDRCGRYLVGRVGPTRRGKRAHSVKRSGESVAAELSLSRRMDT